MTESAALTTAKEQEFRYIVTVKCATAAQASTVMTERLGYDEPYHEDAEGNTYPGRYGFDYSLDWQSAEVQQ